MSRGHWITVLSDATCAAPLQAEPLVEVTLVVIQVSILACSQLTQIVMLSLELDELVASTMVIYTTKVRHGKMAASTTAHVITHRLVFTNAQIDAYNTNTYHKAAHCKRNLANVVLNQFAQMEVLFHKAQLGVCTRTSCTHKARHGMMDVHINVHV